MHAVELEGGGGLERELRELVSEGRRLVVLLRVRADAAAVVVVVRVLLLVEPVPERVRLYFTVQNNKKPKNSVSMQCARWVV